MEKINKVKGNEFQNQYSVPETNSCGVFLFAFNACFDKMWTDGYRNYRESILNVKTTSYQASRLKKDTACLKQGDQHYSHNNHLPFWLLGVFFQQFLSHLFRNAPKERMSLAKIGDFGHKRETMVILQCWV